MLYFGTNTTHIIYIYLHNIILDYHHYLKLHFFVFILTIIGYNNQYKVKINM